MPQHDHGTVDGFLTWAPRLQAFCLGPCQGIGERREGGQSAHSALDAKVFADLEGGLGGGQDAGHLHVGWTHSTRMAATSVDQGS